MSIVCLEKTRKTIYKIDLFFLFFVGCEVEAPTINSHLMHVEWSRVAKVSCILRHRGVKVKLAYSWAMPAILVAGKSRGHVFISSVSSLSTLFLFLPIPSLSSPLLSLQSFFLPFSGRRHKMTPKD